MSRIDELQKGIENQLAQLATLKALPEGEPASPIRIRIQDRGKKYAARDYLCFTDRNGKWWALHEANGTKWLQDLSWEGLLNHTNSHNFEILSITELVPRTPNWYSAQEMTEGKET